MAATYQTNYNPYSNITISNTGGASGSISGGTYTISSGTGASSIGVSNGTYATSWSQPSTNFQSSNGKTIMNIPHGEERVVLSESATLDVKGTVKINGIDLEERLKTIEKLLNIPQRDVIMEAKYPSLKKLHDQYMHELAKYTTWERIKGGDE